MPFSCRIIRLAVISSIPPDPSRIAGALILSRWLDHPQIDWTYIEPLERRKTILWRVMDRLTRTRLYWLARPLKRFYESNNLAKYLRHEAFFRHCLRELVQRKPDIILSVAHGPFYKIAHRASKQSEIPFVLLAQDWYPAFKDAGSGRRRQAEERDFISICRASAVTIAVSEGMLKELGNPPNAVVIHDLPSEVDGNQWALATRRGQLLKVIYAGNLSTYGLMVEQAARACMQSNLVRLEIYGREPIRWSAGTEEEFHSSGIYRGFVSPTEFPEVASGYDLVLAIMSFEPAMRQRMRTCFLSKIIELAQLGKPIVIWGPEDCSAIVWARKSGAALCVTEESPDVLRSALEVLAENPDEQARLVRAIRESAANEFNPTKIRRTFMAALEGAIQAP